MGGALANKGPQSLFGASRHPRPVQSQALSKSKPSASPEPNPLQSHALGPSKYKPSASLEPEPPKSQSFFGVTPKPVMAVEVPSYQPKAQHKRQQAQIRLPTPPTRSKAQHRQQQGCRSHAATDLVMQARRVGVSPCFVHDAHALPHEGVEEVDKGRTQHRPNILHACGAVQAVEYLMRQSMTSMKSQH